MGINENVSLECLFDIEFILIPSHLQVNLFVTLNTIDRSFENHYNNHYTCPIIYKWFAHIIYLLNLTIFQRNNILTNELV